MSHGCHHMQMPPRSHCGCHQGDMKVTPGSHVSLPGGIWVPPWSHVGNAGVTLGCHGGHVGATMCGWHQGHIGWHQGHMWVSVGTCGCHQVWVPPRSCLGDSGVLSGCHCAHVGATTCGCHQGHIGCHQGHMWVSVGMCGCHQVWVPSRSCLGDTGVSSGCHRAHVGATTCGWHQGHVWVAPRSHVGASGDMRVPLCLGATKVMFGWH